jgi:GGDEF domain-containing protein
MFDGQPRAMRRDKVVPASAREQYASLFDPLTQLPGWALLLDRTRIALARATRHGPLVAVIVLDDVRSTKTTADFTALGNLLTQGLRADDTVARISGRTFVMVLNDIRDRSVVTRIAQRLVYDAAITCRLGIAFDDASDDAEQLLGRALRHAAEPLA